MSKQAIAQGITLSDLIELSKIPKKTMAWKKDMREWAEKNNLADWPSIMLYEIVKGADWPELKLREITKTEPRNMSPYDLGDVAKARRERDV